MKKFIFSAVAMIAFVGSSMANNSEVKETTFKEEKFMFSQCSDVYQATWISAKKNGANDEQAGAVAFDAYQTCLGISPPVIIP